MSIYDLTDDFMISVRIDEDLTLVKEKCSMSKYLNDNFNEFMRNSKSNSNLINIQKFDKFRMLGIDVEFNNGQFTFEPIVEIKLNDMPETLIVNHVYEDESNYSIGGFVRLLQGDMSLGIKLVTNPQIVRARLLSH